MPRILELALAVSDGDKVAGGDVIVVHQVVLDGIGTPLRQVLVVGVPSDGVRVAGHNEGRTLQVGIGERAAKRLHRGERLGAYIRGVIVEGNGQIDVRLFLGNG